MCCCTGAAAVPLLPAHDPLNPLLSHNLVLLASTRQNERDDTVDDLVKSDFLHEPG